MSAERLRAMLSEATLPWKINWYENGGVESIDLGESDFISTDGTFYGPNPQNARLIALAPDAIALLADAQDALTALTSYDFHATQHIAGLEHDGHALRALHTEDVDALIRDVTAGREVLARLDAFCGDDR